MKWKAIALAVVLGLTANSSAQAVDWGKIFCLPWCVPKCDQPTCCDDYCPKRMPCVPEIRCFGCDYYCPKCEPCTKQVCCFGCDDYCFKCPPLLRCPPCTDLKCVPGSARCASCSQGTAAPCTSCSERSP